MTDSKKSLKVRKIAAQQLRDFKKKSKVSWEKLGLTEDAPAIISDYLD